MTTPTTPAVDREELIRKLIQTPDRQFYSDAPIYKTVDLMRQAAALLAATPAAVETNNPCLPNGLRYRMPPIVLSGYQLREALYFLAPDGTHDQLEQSVRIAERDDIKDDDGETTLPAGFFAWLDDCPDEGCFALNGAQREARHAPDAAVPMVPSPATTLQWPPEAQPQPEAVYTLHLPNGLVHACKHHASTARLQASFLGTHAYLEESPAGTACTYCATRRAG